MRVESPATACCARGCVRNAVPLQGALPRPLCGVHRRTWADHKRISPVCTGALPRPLCGRPSHAHSGSLSKWTCGPFPSRSCRGSGKNGRDGRRAGQSWGPEDLIRGLLGRLDRAGLHRARRRRATRPKTTRVLRTRGVCAVSLLLLAPGSRLGRGSGQGNGLPFPSLPLGRARLTRGSGKTPFPSRFPRAVPWQLVADAAGDPAPLTPPSAVRSRPASLVDGRLRRSWGTAIRAVRTAVLHEPRTVLARQPEPPSVPRLALTYKVKGRRESKYELRGKRAPTFTDVTTTLRSPPMGTRRELTARRPCARGSLCAPGTTSTHSTNGLYATAPESALRSRKRPLMAIFRIPCTAGYGARERTGP